MNAIWLIWNWGHCPQLDFLVPAKLESSSRDLKTVDVGGCLGFCTEGIVQYVDAEHLSLLDQSPNQITKVKSKSSLNGVTFIEGGAENLPFQSGRFDRATSAGSVEYCP